MDTVYGVDIAIVHPVYLMNVEHLPTPFNITQPKNWFLFYRPTGWKVESTCRCCLQWIYVFLCILTDIADAICFLLVGPSDLAAKSSVEVFMSLTVKIAFINIKWHIGVNNCRTVT